MAFEELFGFETPNMLLFPNASSYTIPSGNGSTIMLPVNGLGGLPLDALLLVVSFLNPSDLVKCRRVCKSWNLAFSDSEVLYSCLKLFFPNAREVREVTPYIRQIRRAPAEFTFSYDWRGTFDELTARYLFMSRGRARTVHRLKQYVRDESTYYYPVKAWDEHESFGAQNQAWLYDHTFWSYDDGLLAFPSEDDRSIVVLDVISQQKGIVSFDMSNKIIRNLRLSQRTLVIEWAEIDPFHQLNELESVYRHFATCFNIIRTQHQPADPGFEITFRNEWKIHFLGLPLSDRDRFFSFHTHDYYVVYFWQQNRSMYTGQEIESLAVWDISTASKYLPSADASGKHAPENQLVGGPHALRRYNFIDLHFYGILQGDSPSMMSFQIDDTAENLYWVENEYIRPTNAFNLGQNQWRSRVIIIPLASGPVNRKIGERSLPPYAGSCSFEARDQRYPPEDTFIGVMDVYDAESQVNYSLQRTNFSGPFNWTVVKIKAGEETTVDLTEKLAEQVTYKGRIAGDERLLIGENSRQEIVILIF